MLAAHAYAIIVSMYIKIVQLAVATKCGADVVLNPSKCDVVKEVKALTDGFGCDVYIEIAGHPESVRQG